MYPKFPGTAILHLDLDSFFVSVEVLKDSALKGKPVAIGSKTGRGVVSSCSYEARKFGVHSAMPMRQAMALCPDLIAVEGDMTSYSDHSRMVTQIIAEDTPLFQKSSIDEFYVDLSGMDRFFGSVKWAKQIRQRIMKDTGLPISFGLATNKLIAKVATGEAKPNGEKVVPPGEEKSFLAQMPIGKIPMLGKKTVDKLMRLGISRVWQLSNITPERAESIFGKHGLSLWQKANGIGSTTITPFHEAKSVSAERTFSNKVDDDTFFESLITGLSEKVMFRTRKDDKLIGCVTIKLRYSDFETHTRQVQIPYTNADLPVIHKAKELLKAMYEPHRQVRLIGVKVSDMIASRIQTNLFDDTEKAVKLHQVMDGIKDKHGSKMIFRAEGMSKLSKRPDVNPFDKN